MAIIDSHAHLNFKSYENDLKEVINRCFEQDTWVINVGTKYETSKQAIKIAERYNDKIYASVGLHPIHLASEVMKIKMDEQEGGFFPKGERFDILKYKELCKSPKVVAIGEIGLDFYYKPKTKSRLEIFQDEQAELLSEQMDLAKELNLPVIFHCRKAHNQLIEILKNNQVFGVIHCFTGTWKEAKQYLDMGFYLGINGIIYKLNLKEVIEKIPLNRMLLETDCPYLTPPAAKVERNEPVFVRHIAKDVAKIKRTSFEEIVRATTQNTQNLFGI